MEDVTRILSRLQEITKTSSIEELEKKLDMQGIAQVLQRSYADKKFFYSQLRLIGEKLSLPVEYIIGETRNISNITNSVVVGGDNKGDIKNQVFYKPYKKEIEIYEIKEYEFYGDDVQDRVEMDDTQAAIELLEKHNINYFSVDDAKFIQIVDEGIAYPVKLWVEFTAIVKQSENVKLKDKEMF